MRLRGQSPAKYLLLRRQLDDKLDANSPSISIVYLRRASYWDHYDKLCNYLFPYGWKVHGPATEESGLLVVKLVGLLYAMAILFDVILAFFIDELDQGNQVVIVLFVGSFVVIVACIFAIARQPQIRCVCVCASAFGNE